MNGGNACTVSEEQCFWNRSFTDLQTALLSHTLWKEHMNISVCTCKLAFTSHYSSLDLCSELFKDTFNWIPIEKHVKMSHFFCPLSKYKNIKLHLLSNSRVYLFGLPRIFKAFPFFFLTWIPKLPAFHSKRSLTSQGITPITACDCTVITVTVCSYMSSFFLLAINESSGF